MNCKYWINSKVWFLCLKIIVSLKNYLFIKRKILFYYIKITRRLLILFALTLPRNDYTYALQWVVLSFPPYGVAITQLPRFDLCFSLSHTHIPLFPSLSKDLFIRIWPLLQCSSYIRQRRHDHCVRPHENAFLIFLLIIVL